MKKSISVLHWSKDDFVFRFFFEILDFSTLIFFKLSKNQKNQLKITENRFYPKRKIVKSKIDIFKGKIRKFIVKSRFCTKNLLFDIIFLSRQKSKNKPQKPRIDFTLRTKIENSKIDNLLKRKIRTFNIKIRFCTNNQFFISTFGFYRY